MWDCYKKQRNLCLNLLRKTKQNKYFKNFRKTFFSDKGLNTKKITLIEKNNLISEESVLVNTMNQYFTGFTILPTHSHPPTTTNTQLHPPTPTQTQSHLPTPTHKNALNSHTLTQMCSKKEHLPINVFKKSTTTHKCAFNSYKHSHPPINIF